MGEDILPGHTYQDGEVVNGPSLTEHVSEATIKPTFYSSRTAKDPVVLTDEFLVRDTVADQYRKVSLTTLLKLMVGAGSVIQTSYAEYTANSNLTAVIPADDTIPQNVEGTEIVQATITPIFAASRILVRFYGSWSGNVANPYCTAALFRDAAAAALLATSNYTNPAVNTLTLLSFEYLDSPASTSPLVYKVRVGPSAAYTVRFNGATTTRLYGGTMRTTLTLQEIK